MEKITTNKASQNGVRALSRKLTELLKDKSSQIYQDNVTRFGIPEKYVRQAFSEKTMPETATSGKSEFYLALENRCKILGFAQMTQKNESLAELDRIVIFPENTRKGIRTQLLSKVLAEQKRIRTIIVNAGKEENHEDDLTKRTASNQQSRRPLKPPGATSWLQSPTSWK